MMLYPGKWVLYRWRPGQVRAGQADAAAMVQRVYNDDTVDLIIWGATDRDPIFQNRVAQMSDAVQGHCWRLPDAEVDLMERVAALEADRDAIASQVEALTARLNELTAKPAPAAKRKAA